MIWVTLCYILLIRIAEYAIKISNRGLQEYFALSNNMKPIISSLSVVKKKQSVLEIVDLDQGRNQSKAYLIPAPSKSAINNQNRINFLTKS
jgi:hypothetical protein